MGRIKITKGRKLLILMLAAIITVSVGVRFLVKNAPFKTHDGVVVCIDAGHGGNDVGAVFGDRYEKDDNLRLAEMVRNELENMGITVVMTRNDDEFISLENRCKCANRNQADAFVALHRNSADDGNGVEIWTSSSPSRKEKKLAQSIMSNVKNAGISKDRGVRSGYAGDSNGDYYVNKHTSMPSCLVEMGFITNDKDNELFDINLTDYAKAIAKGISEAVGS